VSRHERRAARAAIAGALCLAALPATKPAFADPWIPAAGEGVVKPMVRLFHGNRAFPPTNFTTNTVPASSESSTQYRVTGVQGLGGGFSLEYDLRGGRVRRFTDHHHVPVADISWGLQDEEVGLNYGIVQTAHFAESAELNVIVPAGSTKPAPSLGTGRWALEPDYQLGAARRWGSLTIILGPRIFLDGDATQLRTTIDTSARATRRLSFTGEIFFVRTIQHSSTIPRGAHGELYNLLRFGAGAQYRLAHNFRPFFLYEINVAGKGIHAGSRLELGVAVHY